MSGDPIDLDAIEARAKEIATSPWRDVVDLDDLGPQADTTLALVAEVRRLRAGEARVRALADAWDETPDYAPSDYDRGRVEQRHDMTTELLATLDGT